MKNTKAEGSIKFKDVELAGIFIFASEVEYGGVARGPWVKTSRFGYRHTGSLVSQNKVRTGTVAVYTKKHPPPSDAGGPCGLCKGSRTLTANPPYDHRGAFNYTCLRCKGTGKQPKGPNWYTP